MSLTRTASLCISIPLGTRWSTWARRSPKSTTHSLTRTLACLRAVRASIFATLLICKIYCKISTYFPLRTSSRINICIYVFARKYAELNDAWWWCCYCCYCSSIRLVHIKTETTQNKTNKQTKNGVGLYMLRYEYLFSFCAHAINSNYFTRIAISLPITSNA